MSNRSSGEQSMTVVDACLPRGIGFHRVPTQLAIRKGSRTARDVRRGSAARRA
jgi:hypothetical protein